MNQSSAIDRNGEFEQWVLLAEEQLKSTDEAAVQNRSSRRSSIENRFTITHNYAREANGEIDIFYEAIKDVQREFDSLRQIYPLEHDNSPFRVHARNVDQLLKVAEGIANDHAQGRLVQIEANSGGTIWKTVSDLFGSSRHSGFILPEGIDLADRRRSNDLVNRHRKHIIDTLHKQLVTYLKTIEVVRKASVHYINRNRFASEDRATRRKRLAELVKSKYRSVENDEVRTMAAPAYPPERRFNPIPSLDYTSTKEEFNTRIMARGRRLSAINGEPETSELYAKVKHLLSKDRRHPVPPIVVEGQFLPPHGDQAISSSEVEEAHERYDLGSTSPDIDLPTTSMPSTHAFDESQNQMKPDERIQMDDLISHDYPLMQQAHQGLADVSSLLNIFVDHLTTQSETAVEFLQTTETSTEMISEAVIQLKEAIKNTERRQLYFLILFALMASTLLGLDLLI